MVAPGLSRSELSEVEVRFDIAFAPDQGLRERARLPVPDRRVRFWTELTEQHAES